MRPIQQDEPSYTWMVGSWTRPSLCQLDPPCPQKQKPGRYSIKDRRHSTNRESPDSKERRYNQGCHDQYSYNRVSLNSTFDILGRIQMLQPRRLPQYNVSPPTTSG